MTGEVIFVCEDFIYFGNSLMLQTPSAPTIGPNLQERPFYWHSSSLTLSALVSSSRGVHPSQQLGRVPMTPTRECVLVALLLIRYALGLKFPQRISTRQLMVRGDVPPINVPLLRCQMSWGLLDPRSSEPDSMTPQQDNARTIKLASTFNTAFL